MAEDLAVVETPVEIEQRTIAQVPAAERKGKVRNLFTIWFASNVMLLTVVTGALATTERWTAGVSSLSARTHQVS